MQQHIAKRGSVSAAASASNPKVKKAETEVANRTAQCITRVSADLSRHFFPPAIKAIQQLTTTLSSPAVASVLCGTAPYESSLKVMLRLLAPAAPHITSELWLQLTAPTAGSAAGSVALDEATDIHRQPWPQNVAPKSTAPHKVQSDYANNCDDLFALAHVSECCACLFETARGANR